jgi:hypothetical protein
MGQEGEGGNNAIGDVREGEGTTPTGLGAHPSPPGKNVIMTRVHAPPQQLRCHDRW